MDSCNVMQGSKSGLEARIQEKAPHLLDIEGNSCHHNHNSAKKFCKPFKGHVEKYFTDHLMTLNGLQIRKNAQEKFVSFWENSLQLKI